MKNPAGGGVGAMRVLKDEQSISRRGQGCNWHNALPSWIRADTTYHELRQGVRHTLQAIANRCDKPEEGCELLLVCFSGERVFASCGCRRSTFKAHVRKLESLGYVIPLTRGGGRLATIYGIPGERGQLDQHRAEKKAKPRLWRRADSEQLRSLVSGFETLATPAPLVSGNRTAPVRESDGYCPEIGHYHLMYHHHVTARMNQL